MDPENYKMTIPLYIVTILGVWMIVEYFIPALGPLVPVTDTIRTFATILAAASWGLGTAILCIAHGRRIIKQTKTPFWGYSLLFVICFIVMLGSALLEGLTGATWLWFYNYIIGPTGQALYSTTAFYVTTAGYRVFRFRNIDAAVLLICGMFLMWAVLPLFTGPFPVLVSIAGWINDVIAVAAYRGFVMGVALGIIGLAVRVFLHKHREVLA